MNWRDDKNSDSLPILELLLRNGAKPTDEFIRHTYCYLPISHIRLLMESLYSTDKILPEVTLKFSKERDFSNVKIIGNIEKIQDRFQYDCEKVAQEIRNKYHLDHPVQITQPSNLAYTILMVPPACAVTGVLLLYSASTTLPIIALSSGCIITGAVYYFNPQIIDSMAQKTQNFIDFVVGSGMNRQAINRN